MAFRMLAGLVLAAVLAAAQPVTPQPVPTTDPANTVLIFVPRQLFGDAEYEPVARQLGLAGFNTKLASRDSGLAVGMGPDNQLVLQADVRIADARPQDYAALVLIGGSGMVLAWDDTVLHARCREFLAAGKPVGAIGIAPITLAKAGLLNGVRATVFQDRKAVGLLKAGGAKYSFRPLVEDRKIITAANADVAVQFARRVAAAARRK